MLESLPLENSYPSNVKLKYKKLSYQATTPTRGSLFAAGYDLYAAHEATIPPGGRELIKTDIQVIYIKIVSVIILLCKICYR